MEVERLLTPDEAAMRLSVTRNTIYRWLASGELQAVKAGTRVRIPESAITAMLRPWNTAVV